MKAESENYVTNLVTFQVDMLTRSRSRALTLTTGWQPITAPRRARSGTIADTRWPQADPVLI